jgi:hypothetical protein
MTLAILGIEETEGALELVAHMSALQTAFGLMISGSVPRNYPQAARELSRE